MLPLVQIRQVDLAVGVDVLASFDHHGTGRFDKTYGRVVGIRVQQPQTHRDVVDIAYRKHTQTACCEMITPPVILDKLGYFEKTFYCLYPAFRSTGDIYLKHTRFMICCTVNKYTFNSLKILPLFDFKHEVNIC